MPDPELYEKARAYVSAHAQLESMSKSRGIEPKFYADNSAVYWGPPIPGQRKGAETPLFICDDPASVAAELNAVVDAAKATFKTSETARLEALALAAENSLKAVGSPKTGGQVGGGPAT